MGVPAWTAAAVSAVICVVSVLRTRGVGGYWVLDPRGAASVLVFLHVAGYPLYYVMHGKYPESFGFEPLFADRANFMMVTAQLGFLVGTAVIPAPRRFGPGLHLDEQFENTFLRVLYVAALATSVALVYPTWSNWSTMASSPYGSSGGYGDLAAKYARFTNVGLIAVPTFLMLMICRGTSRRPLLTRGTVVLLVICLVPAVLGGGRKELFLVVGAVFLAWTFRLKRRPWKEAAVFAAVLAVLSLAVLKSRSGPTLAVEDRVAAVAEIRSEESSIADQFVLMYAGTMSLTAAMTIYPDVVQHTLGESYFEAAVNVLSPAFLTGRYPYTPMAHQFRELYYPDVESFGFDYAMSAEAYQNFGIIGPFLLFALAGYLLSTSFARAVERRPFVNPWLPIHVITLLSVLYGLRTDSNGLFKQIAYGWVWVAALVYATRMFGSRGRARASTPARSGVGGLAGNPGAQRP